MHGYGLSASLVWIGIIVVSIWFWFPQFMDAMRFWHLPI